MRSIWMVLKKRDVKRVLYFILLGFVWVWISWGLATTSAVNGGNMTLKPVLQTKILLMGALFGGRYLFFPKYRRRQFFNWSVFLLFLLIVGAGWVQTGEWRLNYLYLTLTICDDLIWAGVLGAFFELYAANFYQPSAWNEINPGTLGDVWRSLSRDLIKTGIFISITLGILYYYLVNLFLVDIFCYSYLLLIPLLGSGGALFGRRYYPVWRRLNKAIQDIDEQMTDVINADETSYREILPRYQFLVLSRNYLVKLKLPGMLLRTIVGYILCTSFLLILPYILGFAIEV